MTQRTAEDVDLVVVHASATPPGMDIGSREIDRWHRERGWLQIGYHGVIRRDGTYEGGRPWHKPGAHVEGHNKRSLGFCLVGGVDDEGNAEDNFTPAQFQMLKSIIESAARIFGPVDVVGHNSFPSAAVECPCTDVNKFLVEYQVNY